jgi:hypothetical protein
MPLRKHTKDLFDRYKSEMVRIELDSILAFEQFFIMHPPASDAKGYDFVELESAASFDLIWRGKGFYMIASDFKPELARRDGCTLLIDGLPVIYRGQADLVRERVQSHLDNTRYRAAKEKRNAGTWKRCLKLDQKPGDGGVDFDCAPYRDYRWAVLVLPLRNSKTGFRNYVEWGFDAVFGKPLASNEKAKGPSESLLGEARRIFSSVSAV